MQTDLERDLGFQIELADGVVVEQDGEVTFEGCSIVSSDAAEDDSTEGSATSSMNVDTEAAATTTTNVEVGSDLDTSVEADVEAESETEAQY